MIIGVIAIIVDVVTINVTIIIDVFILITNKKTSNKIMAIVITMATLTTIILIINYSYYLCLTTK